MKNIMRINYLFYFSLLLFISCKNNSVGPTDPQNLWPMQPGQAWLYKVTVPSSVTDTLKREIKGSINVHFEDQIYTAMEMAVYFSGGYQPDHNWLFRNGPNGVYLMGGVSATDTMVVNQLNFKYPASVGDSWQCQEIAYSAIEQKFYIYDTVTYRVVSVNIPINTPVGNFLCYQYQYSRKPEEDIGVIYDFNFYFSPGLGLVSQSSQSRFDGKIKDEYILINQ